MVERGDSIWRARAPSLLVQMMAGDGRVVLRYAESSGKLSSVVSRDESRGSLVNESRVFPDVFDLFRVCDEGVPLMLI